MKKVLLSGVAGAALLMFAVPAMAGGITLVQGQKVETSAEAGDGGDAGGVSIPAGSTLGTGSPLTADGGDGGEGGEAEAEGGQFQYASLDWGDGPLVTVGPTTIAPVITVEGEGVENTAEAEDDGIAIAGNSNTVNVESWNTDQVNESELKAMNIKSSVSNVAGGAGNGGSAEASNESEQYNEGEAKGGSAEASNSLEQDVKAESGSADASVSNEVEDIKGGSAEAELTNEVDDIKGGSAEVELDANDGAEMEAKSIELAAAAEGGEGGEGGEGADGEAGQRGLIGSNPNNIGNSGTAADGGDGGEGGDGGRAAAAAGDLEQEQNPIQVGVALAGDAENNQDGEVKANGGDAENDQDGTATARTGDATARNDATQTATANGGNGTNLQGNKSDQGATANGGNGGGSNQVFAWLGTGAVGAVLLSNVRGITNISMSSGINVNQTTSVSVNASASFN